MSKLNNFINLPPGMDQLVRQELTRIFRDHANQVNRMTHDWTTVETATTVAHDLVLADASSTATLVVTLPPALDWEDALLRVKKIDSSTNKIFIVGANSETVDGTATKTIHSQYTCFQLFSDGTQWWIV